MDDDTPDILVRVGTDDWVPSEDQLKAVREVVEDEFPEKQTVVTDSAVEVAKIPELDDYADEIADRVADTLREDFFHAATYGVGAAEEVREYVDTFDFGPWADEE